MVSPQGYNSSLDMYVCLSDRLNLLSSAGEEVSGELDGKGIICDGDVGDDVEDVDMLVSDVEF